MDQKDLSSSLVEPPPDDDYYTEVDEDDDEAATYAIWLPQTPFFVPSQYEISLPDGQTRIFCLDMKQRIYLVLDSPNSCQLANMYSKFMLVIILLSILAVIGSTVDYFQHTPTTCHNPACDNDPNYCPGYQICAPVSNDAFYTLDIVVIAIFAADFFSRLLLVSYMPARLSGTVSEDWDYDEKKLAEKQNRQPRSDPVRSWQKQLTYFLFSMGTLIDLLAIIPAFVLIFLQVSSSSTAFIRIFRMFRIFKMSKKFIGVIGVFRNALKNSKDALIILAFSLVVAVIVLACVEYSIELGTFTVNADYPTGAFINKMDEGQTRLSPYTSIPVSMYWAVITLSTIGYGDIYPVTAYGRGIACLAAVLGIIVIALPVTVLGSNFSNEYEIYTKRQAEYRELRQALRVKQAKAAANASRRTSNLSKGSTRSARSMSSRRQIDNLDGTKNPLSPIQYIDGLGSSSFISSINSASGGGPVLTKSMCDANISEMNYLNSSNSSNSEQLNTLRMAMSHAASAATADKSIVISRAVDANSIVFSEIIARQPPNIQQILIATEPTTDLNRDELNKRFEDLKAAHLQLLAVFDIIKNLASK